MSSFVFILHVFLDPLFKERGENYKNENMAISNGRTSLTCNEPPLHIYMYVTSPANKVNSMKNVISPVRISQHNAKWVWNKQQHLTSL